MLHVHRGVRLTRAIELATQTLRRAARDGDDLVQNLHAQGLADVPAHLAPRLPAGGHEAGAEDLQERRVGKLEIFVVILEVGAHDASHRARVRDDDAVPRENLHAHGLGRGRGGPRGEQVPRARVVPHRLEQRDRVPEQRDVPRRHRRAAKDERLAVPTRERDDRAEDEAERRVRDRGARERDRHGRGHRGDVECHDDDRRGFDLAPATRSGTPPNVNQEKWITFVLIVGESRSFQTLVGLKRSTVRRTASSFRTAVFHHHSSLKKKEVD